MIRDITIGQYYPADSKIHRLDPRTKILCTLLYLISLFLFQNIYGYLLATVFLASVIAISKVPFKFIVKGLKPILILLFVTVFFNLFLTKTGNVLIEVWKIKVTDDGVKAAFFMMLRLIYLILGSSLMTFTTTPNALTDGIERILWPLRKIKVPVHDFAMMMSIVLRFIPALSEETEKIMTAQKSRGADFESGSLIQRAKALIPILIPLFVSAFRRSDELATAMECRCYHGGHGRTRMTVTRMTSLDFLFLALMLVCVAAIFLLNFIDFGYVM
jgi:energy-coupling factor transport system permease protein